MSAKDELASFTASDLVRLYRRRDVSPVEVAGAVLARVERLNGRFNAFCLVDGESALREAKASEARWLAGTPRSYVDGIPATIKDIILTKGWPTLRGSRTVDPAQPWE
jgi:aspartyl-tRNA(Asn)/glutamyl-tRNA(Gln) amidotransferase subunit A